jgi:hypothetical protein
VLENGVIKNFDLELAANRGRTWREVRIKDRQGGPRSGQRGSMLIGQVLVFSYGFDNPKNGAYDYFGTIHYDEVAAVLHIDFFTISREKGPFSMYDSLLHRRSSAVQSGLYLPAKTWRGNASTSPGIAPVM